MAAKTSTELKALFETGDTLLESSFEDLIDSVNVIVPFERELTQAEVRTLNSANAGYGAKLIDGVANNVIQIFNPLIIYKATGGTFATADIWLYDDVYSISGYYKGSTNSASFTPITLIEQPELEPSSYLGIAGDVYIWSSVEQSSFEGTWVIKFDYKFIDIT